MHQSYPLATPAENDVRSIAVEPSGRVWVATGAGVRYLEDGNWKKPSGGTEIGPVYTIHRDASGVIWAGAWNGLYTVTQDAVSSPVISDTLISAIGEYDNSESGAVMLIAAGPHGIWHIDGRVAKRIETRTQTSIRAVLPVRGNKVWVGTADGLFLLDLSSNPVKCTRYSEPSVVLSSNISSLKALPSGDVAIGSTGGEHTGMYLAMESFRYAVTHDATARDEAKAAFHGLVALQRVTGTSHFIARSMLPMGTAPRHELDTTYTPQQVAEMGRIVALEARCELGRGGWPWRLTTNELLRW